MLWWLVALPALGAFLDSLPLKIVSISPNSDTYVTLTGRDALTVVFSRPVVELGADDDASKTMPFQLLDSKSRVVNVTGKFRWATTYIARFDTDLDWPTDLDFTLVANANLVSFDGVPLVNTNIKQRYKTAQLSACISKVVSRQASLLTNNAWVGSYDGKNVEVPPDGQVEVTFSYRPDVRLIRQNLQIREISTGRNISFSIANCSKVAVVPLFGLPSPSSQNQNCLAFTPSNLINNRSYELWMPAGASYHPTAGVLSTKLSINFTSLLPFVFPVPTPVAPSVVAGPYSHNTYELILIHGLSQDVSESDFQSQFKLFKTSRPVSGSGGLQVDMGAGYGGFGAGPAFPIPIRASAPLPPFNQQQGGNIPAQQSGPGAFPGFPGMSAPFPGNQNNIFPGQIQIQNQNSPGFPPPFMPGFPPGASGSGPTNQVQMIPGQQVNIVQGPFQGMPSVGQQTQFPGFPTYIQNRQFPMNAGFNQGQPPVIQQYQQNFQIPQQVAVPRVTQQYPQFPQNPQQPPAQVFQQYPQFTQYPQSQTPVQPISQSGPLTSTPVSFTVSLVNNRSSVRIRAAIQPNAFYMLQILGQQDGYTKIKDGYNQVLQSQVITWSTNELPSFFSAPNGFLFFEKSQWNTTQWFVLTRGGTQQPSMTLSLAPVQFANIAASLTALDNPSTPLNSITTRASSNTDPTFRALALTIPSNFFVRDLQSSGMPYERTLTVITDLGVSVIFGSQNSVLVWVTRLSDGTNVQGASVQFLTSNGGAYSIAAQGTTQQDGTALLQVQNPTQNGLGSKVFVSSGNDATILVNAWSYFQSQSTPSVSIVTDRLIYKPGDTVYLKAYCRYRNANGWSLPPDSASAGVLSVQWDMDYRSSPLNIPVAWSRDYGSWNGSLVIPANASYGVTTVTITAKSNDPNANSGQWVSWDSSGSVALTIADPRIPTAKLTLTTPDVFCRISNPTFPIILTLTTGTGGAISGGRVGIDWQFYGVNGSSETGIATLVSGPDGTATGTWDARTNLSVADLWAQGGTVYVNAKWVGPTGEYLTDSFTKTIGKSDWTLNIEPMLSNPIPGVPFAARVSVTDSANKPVRNRVVSVVLGQVVDLNAPEKDIVVAACNVNLTVTAQCAPAGGFFMNKLLRYRLSATVTDSTNYRLRETTIVGLPQELPIYASAVSPLSNGLVSQFPGVNFYLDKTVYSLGDTAKISFWSPFSKATALVRYGNEVSQKTIQTSAVRGFNSIPIKIQSPECSSGCAVTVVLVAPRQAKTTFDVPSSVPTSILFDIYAPRSFQQQLPISLQATAPLQVNIAVPEKATPGQAVQVQVAVLRNGVPTKSEVAIAVVDQAIIDMNPPPLDAVTSQFGVSVNQPFITYDTQKDLNSYRAYRATAANFSGRITLDPWITPNWQLTPDVWMGKSDLDKSDDEFLSQFSTQLTAQSFPPFCSNSFALPAMGLGLGLARFDAATAAPVPQAVSTSANYAPAQLAQPPKFATAVDPTRVGRSNFQVTPFFRGRVIVDPSDPSSGLITIKLPDNLATFSVRVYAVDEQAFGANETSLVVSQQLNLQSLLPRFARPGDFFEAGVTVAGGDSSFQEPVSVTVTASTSGKPGTVKAPLTQSLQVTGTSPVPVTFSMTANETGNFALGFSAAGLSSQDSLAASIPILPIQDPITVATSVSLNVSRGVWSEGLRFPSAVSGTGNYTITAGVARYPSILALANSLDPVDTPTNSYSKLAVLYTSSVVKKYTLAEYSGVAKRLIDGTAAAVMFLAQSTTPSSGLQWDNSSTVSSVSSLDVDLNLFGLYVASKTKLVGNDTQKIWQNVVEQYLIKGAASNQTDYESLAKVFEALGSSWSPTQYRSLLSLNSLVNKWSSLSLETKLRLALTHLTYGQVPSGPQIINVTTQQVLSYFRVQGSTGYVSTPGIASAAPFRTQALALSMLSKSGSSHPFVEKLANYVAQGTYFSFPADIALACAALADFDGYRGTLRPSLELTAYTGTFKLFGTTFTSPSAGITTVRGNWATLSRSVRTTDKGTIIQANPLNFVANGTGQVSIGVSLTYVPSDIPTDPVYKGLYVEKIIQLVDPSTNQASGPNTVLFKKGSVVKVTIQVTSPDDLENVQVTDLLPGGLEAIDPNLKGPSFDNNLPLDTVSSIGPNFGGPAVPVQSQFAPAVDIVRPQFATPAIAIAISPSVDSAPGLLRPSIVSPFLPWQAFGNQQTNFDRVSWNSNSLSAGTYSLSYFAVAVTSGSWLVPPTKAWVLTQPEVMGLSVGSRLAITTEDFAAEDVTQILSDYQIAPATKFVPKNCGCGPNSSCNVRTGVCTDVSSRFTSIAGRAL